MNLELLSNFMVLTGGMNLTKASQALYITQSALSRQMTRLERSLDVQLFIRDGHTLSLTPAGELLRSRAPELLRLAARIQTDLKILEQEKMTRLQVGTFSLTEGRFADCISAYRHSKKDISVNIIPGEPDDVLRMVQTGVVDIALTTQIALDVLAPGEMDLLKTLALVKSHACAVVRPGHPLASRDTVTFADLRGEHLVTMYDPSANRHLQAVFKEMGFQPRELTIGDPRTLRYLVNYQDAVAILFEDVTLDLLDKCPTITIMDAGLETNLCFVWRTRNDQTVRPFVDQVLQYLTK